MKNDAKKIIYENRSYSGILCSINTQWLEFRYILRSSLSVICASCICTMYIQLKESVHRLIRAIVFDFIQWRTCHCIFVLNQGTFFPHLHIHPTITKYSNKELRWLVFSFSFLLITIRFLGFLIASCTFRCDSFVLNLESKVKELERWRKREKKMTG